MGFQVGDEEIAQMVEDAQCYSFFPQLWRESLARTVTALGASEVTQEHFNEAFQRMEDKSRCYGRRLEELEKCGLVKAALIGGRIFRERSDGRHDGSAQERHLPQR